MGHPLVLNKTLDHLTQNALGDASAQQGLLTLDRLLAAAAQEQVSITLLLFSLDEFEALYRKGPVTPVKRFVRAFLALLLEQTPEDVYLECTSLNEFLLILPHIPPENAELAVNEIRQRFRAAIEQSTQRGVSGLVSATWAIFPQDGEARPALLSRMREEIFRIQGEGGNLARPSAPVDWKQVPLHLPPSMQEQLTHRATEMDAKVDEIVQEALHDWLRRNP